MSVVSAVTATADIGSAALHPPPLRRATSVARIERRKLAAQLPLRVAALVCLLGPFAFAAPLRIQSGAPADALYGNWVHSSGFALSLVVLGFAANWSVGDVSSPARCWRR